MVDDLIPVARRRIPKFAFEFLDGGAGRETLLARNVSVFDQVQLIPRYMRDVSTVNTAKTLFGRKYEFPFGIAPVGLGGLIWPGAENYAAKAARDSGIPFALSTAAAVDIEEISEIAGDISWFQLYNPQSHEIRVDLLKRASNAGMNVLIVTVDVPGPTRRERTVRSGLTLPPRITTTTVVQTLSCPAYIKAFLRCGIPKFRNFLPYIDENQSLSKTTQFIGQQLGLQMDDDDISELRDLWPGSLVIKGVLHPEDAERVVRLGVDGILVSNHGGRQTDASPTSLEMLPHIRQAIGDRAAILLDSGVRSGLDVARALACGADFVLLGRAFYYGLAAIGQHGAKHVVNILAEELQQSLRQIGCSDVDKLDETWLTITKSSNTQQEWVIQSIR